MKTKFKHIADEIPKQQLHVIYKLDGHGYFELSGEITQQDGFVKCDGCDFYKEKSQVECIDNIPKVAEKITNIDDGKIYSKHIGCGGYMKWSLEDKWKEQQIVIETINLLNKIFQEDPLQHHEDIVINDKNVRRVLALTDADSYETFCDKILRESIYNRLRISDLKNLIVDLDKTASDSRNRILQLEGKIQQIETANVTNNDRIYQLEMKDKSINEALGADFKDYLERNQAIVTDLIKRIIEGQQIGNISHDLTKVKRTLNIMIDLINFGTDMETIVHTANRRLNSNLYNGTTQLHFNLQYNNDGTYMNLDPDTHKRLLNRFESV
jgi:hypothetical protein